MSYKRIVNNYYTFSRLALLKGSLECGKITGQMRGCGGSSQMPREEGRLSKITVHIRKMATLAWSVSNDSNRYECFLIVVTVEQNFCVI